MPSALSAVVMLGLVAPAAALRVAAVRPVVSSRTTSAIRMADENFDFGEPRSAVPSSTTKVRPQSAATHRLWLDMPASRAPARHWTGRARQAEAGAV